MSDAQPDLSAAVAAAAETPHETPALQEVGAAAAGEPTTSVPAAEPTSQPTATDTAIAAAVTTAAPATDPETDAPNAVGGASAAASLAPVDSAPAATPSQSVGEPGNAVTPSESVAASLSSSAATGTAEAGGEAPNVASSAAAPSASADGNATNAVGAATSSPIAASSVDELPLHSRIAHHLEAIYQLAKVEVEAPARSISTEAADLKAHIADVLRKLHNGIAVSEGILVQKLESIHRLL